MDPNIVFTVSYLGECKLVSITEKITFEQFGLILREKWFNLVDGDISCRCTVGSVSNVCLLSDDDLRNLWFLCLYSNVKIVSVELVCASQPLQVLGDAVLLTDSQLQSESVYKSSSSKNKSVVTYSDQNSSSKRKVVDIFSDSVDQDCLPCYDICPSVNKKVLISDAWADIFKGGVGLTFKGGASEFRAELIKYSAYIGFKFIYVRNDCRYIRVKCSEYLNSNCKWLIKARRQPISGYFEVHSLNLIHDCVGNLFCDDYKRLGSKIMGDLVMNNVKNNPSTFGKDIIFSMRDNYGLDVPYWKAYRAAETAKNDIFGSYDDSYDELRWYCKGILHTNPGSVVALEVNPVSYRFERLFIAFKACVDGFNSCRPFLFIDGTFMKARARGTLLEATAKDGNNGLFPVCFVIVSAENTSNWLWFLEKIRDSVHHDKKINFISDRNLGLLAAFPKVYDKSQHFYCLFHLMTNLKSKFNGKGIGPLRESLIELFKQCAYAPTERIFDDKKALFISLGGRKAQLWIDDLDVQKWAVAFTSISTRFGEMTSNAAKSFNAWIDEARSLPITHMIDHIRSQISGKFVDRRKKFEVWNQLLVPSKDSLWHVLVEDDRSWLVVVCPGGDYQVSSSASVLVDLRNENCSCFQWKVTGFPCVHVVAVIRRFGNDMFKYVDESFFSATLRKSYSFDLNPIPQTLKYEFQSVDEEPKIRPPLLNRPIGCPKKLRISSIGEAK